MDFKKRPIVDFETNDTVRVQPMHFTNIKILWRSDSKELDNMNGESVKYPTDPVTGPTDQKIE